MKVHIRDSELNRVGEIDDYEKLDLVLRFNAVGSWAIDVDASTNAAQKLALPGYGIHVVDDTGGHILSGRRWHTGRSQSGSKNKVTFAGPDDMRLLAARVASPEPGNTDGTYDTNTWDVFTDVGSTVLMHYVNVNAGPGAVAYRRTPMFTLAADPMIGNTITGRARWPNLLTLLATYAIYAGGLGFTVTPVAGPALEFSIFQPVDRSDEAKFSFELGNLVSYDYAEDGAEVTEVYALGSGDGLARVVKEGGGGLAYARWGRLEATIDQRSTSNADELDQAIGAELADKGEKRALTATLTQTDNLRFGVHYGLGDIVTVMVDDIGPVSDVVREVAITLQAGKAPEIAPTVGTPGAAPPRKLNAAQLARQRDHDQRISNLERR